MISDFIDLAETISQPNVIEVATSLLDSLCRLENEYHDRLKDKVFQEEYTGHSSKPISLIVVGITRKSHQSLDGDGPANPENAECCDVVPMEVTENFLLTEVNSLLIFSHFFLISLLDDLLLGVVFDEQFLVDLVHEHFAPDERERNCDNEGNDCRPDEYSRSSIELSGNDGSNEDSLDGPLNEHHC